MVIDGGGEYDFDFHVLVVDADSPQKAVDRVIGPGMDYGKDEDGVAYVAELPSVAVFHINDTRTKRAVYGTFETVLDAMPASSRPFFDPDGGWSGS